ncbi:MAG: hypothetical protein ACLP59_20525 [Bryobacteraceae bacterium]
MATTKQPKTTRRKTRLSIVPPKERRAERGLRAESAVLPGEDQAEFDALLARLSAAWSPQDEMEQSLVEQIAATEWQLARLDRYEAGIYQSVETKPGEIIAAVYRLNQTQSRLRQSISASITDMERYRKGRLERRQETAKKESATFMPGLIWNAGGHRSYTVLPRVLGLDGVWRDIPREILGDNTTDSKLPS